MPSLFRGRTPPIRGGTSASIAVLERLKLVCVDQWLTLRGRDAAQPLLLYLHGGPGTPDLGAIRRFVPELEEHFLVAHWCQRGGGKSYARGLGHDQMTEPTDGRYAKVAGTLVQRGWVRSLGMVTHDPKHAM